MREVEGSHPGSPVIITDLEGPQQENDYAFPTSESLVRIKEVRVQRCACSQGLLLY